MTSRERIGALEVAGDLIEDGREAEARALLDAELPDRHSIQCAACGAYPPNPCREMREVPCKRCSGGGKLTAYNLGYPPTSPNRKSVVACDNCYGTGRREQEVDRVLPHQSRVLRIGAES